MCTLSRPPSLYRCVRYLPAGLSLTDRSPTQARAWALLDGRLAEGAGLGQDVLVLALWRLIDCTYVPMRSA